MNDVIIFSQTWPHRLFHLSQVLSHLNLHGLTVKQSKCPWGSTKFEFLGYVVGEGSLSIPNRHIEKFKSYVMPATKKQLHSFIGLCGYFTRNLCQHLRICLCLNRALTNTSDKEYDYD